MAKRLVISPEVLILGACEGQGEGVARAVRTLVERHGAMPVLIGATTHLGEVCVETDVGRGWVNVDRLRFTADHGT